MKKFIALLSVFVVSIFIGIGFSAVTGISPLIIGGASFVCSFVPLPFGSMYMLLFTSPAVIGTYQFNLTFIPEFLTWNDAGAPITLLRVETQEDGVLTDLNAAGLAAVNGYMKLGAQAANQLHVRLADGHIEGKNVTITVTIAAAAAIAFFGCSDNIGLSAYQYKNAAILALNPTTFEKFTAIFIPTMAAATDRAEVEFIDGHKQTFAVADLIALSSMYNQVQAIIVNNVLSYIKKVTFVCAAATPAYIFATYIKGQ
jgi:hypothetical protein